MSIKLKSIIVLLVMLVLGNFTTATATTNIEVKNQTIVFSSVAKESLFSFTLEEAQLVYFYKKSGIKQFTLLNEDKSKIDYWSSEATVHLEEGTYFLKIATKKGAKSSFNILFGNDINFTKIPEFKGDIEISNHVVKFKNSASYSWFTFTIESTQLVHFYKRSGIKQFTLLNEDHSKIDYWSSDGKIKLEEGTYILKISTKPGGNSSFSILFGNDIDFTQLPEYKGEIDISNHTVKFKNSATFTYFQFSLESAQLVHFYKKSGIKQFTLLNEDHSKIDYWSSDGKIKLQQGTYILKISTKPGGRSSFNILFGNDINFNKIPEYKGDIKIYNQVVKFKNSSTFSWFKFTLPQNQLIHFYKKSGIKQFTLLNEDHSKIDYWSSDGKIKLTKGTYILKITTKPGGRSSFNILFGATSDFSKIPEYKGILEIHNQVVKFKNSSTYSWYKFTITTPKTIKFKKESGIKRFTLLNSDLSKIDYWSNEGKKKLNTGVYLFMITTNNGGKSSFDFMY